MRTSAPVALLAPHDHAGPLVKPVARLLPVLSAAAKRRIAEMAVVMREAALNDGGCEASHLAQAGFTRTEIELAVPLARRALEGVTGPDEMVPCFTHADLLALRGYNARSRAALDLRAA